MNEAVSFKIPSALEMMDWIKTVYDRGIRRPGYPADIWTEDWLCEMFEKFGLENIEKTPVPVNKWESSTGVIKLWHSDESNPPLEIPCFPVPYSGGGQSVKSEVISGWDPGKAKGKIVLQSFPFYELPASTYRLFSEMVFDPEDEFETLNHFIPFGVGCLELFNEAQGGEAVGVIGILENYPLEGHHYYVPFDGVEKNLPMVWVTEDNGQLIKDQLQKGRVEAVIEYTSSVSETVSYNISATLPGESDEWVVIGSHHDGPWNSAVEDASGIALVLAQAKYWSGIPRYKRPHQLRFQLNCGHMAGGAGTEHFVGSTKSLKDKTVAAIHLEHAAKDVKVEDGLIRVLDDPTIRWWFTSRIPFLEQLTFDSIKSENLKRSVIMPPDGFPPDSKTPPTDAAPYHLVQVPFVSFLTAPVYLFDKADTIEKVHVASLEPITRAVIKMILGLKGQTAVQLRRQVREAPVS